MDTLISSISKNDFATTILYGLFILIILAMFRKEISEHFPIIISMFRKTQVHPSVPVTAPADPVKTKTQTDSDTESENDKTIERHVERWGDKKNSVLIRKTIRKVIYMLPVSVMFSDCDDSILRDIIDKHRIKNEEIVFDLTAIQAANQSFYLIFQTAIFEAIEQNNIRIELIFPVSAGYPAHDMGQMYAEIRSMIDRKASTSIKADIDRRAKFFAGISEGSFS